MFWRYVERGYRHIYLDEGHNNRHTYGELGDFVAFKNVLSSQMLWGEPATAVTSLLTIIISSELIHVPLVMVHVI